MRLSCFAVRNFRAIERLEFTGFDFVSFIGPNNACKSTALRAVEMFLNAEAPTPEDFRGNDTSIPIEMEAEFDQIADWERTTPGVAALVQNGKIRLRLTHTFGEKPKFEAYIAAEEIVGWSDKFSELSGEIKAVAGELDITAKKGWSAAGKERIKEKLRSDHPELISRSPADWTSEGISINAALQQALPKAILVPAVLDAEDATKPGAKTPFNRLLQAVLVPELLESEEYRTMSEAATRLAGRLVGGQDSLPAARDISQGLTEKLRGFMEASVRLTIDPPELDKMLGGKIGVRLNDGTDTPVGLQGHGLQRALIFALLEMAGQRDAARQVEEGGNKLFARSTVLLFEEPELYVHPHLMRRLRDLLLAISRREGWQVFIATHSPVLVNVAENPRSLVLFQRESGSVPPVVKQLGNDPFSGGKDTEDERTMLRAALDFHPTVCEVFFAKRAIVVEGPSELAVLRHGAPLLEAAGVSERFASECSVVSAGGKWTIVPIARLLRAFQIHFRVVHDLDRKGRSVEALAEVSSIDPYRANEQIAALVPPEDLFVVDDTLEDILFERPPSSGKDKPYRAWRRVGELISEGKLAKQERLMALIRFVYGEARRPEEEITPDRPDAAAPAVVA